MAKVYQVQHTGHRDKQTGAFIPHDITPVLEFGEIVTLLPSDGPDPALAPGPMVTHLQQKMRNFTSEDYLLPMGSPAAISAAAMVANKYSPDGVNILIWDRKQRGYYVSKMNI